MVSQFIVNYMKNEVSVALPLNNNGEVLLQHRDDKPEIADSNLWAMFGGHKKKGETNIACMIRELSEEIGYLAKEEEYTYLTTFESDICIFNVYLLKLNIPLTELTLMEGQDFSFIKIEDALALPNISPSAKEALNYYKKEAQYE